MSSNKESKNLKRPDAFQVITASFLDTLLKNKKTVTTVLTTLTAVVCVSFVGKYFYDKHIDNRKEALAKIDLLRNDEESSLDKQRKELQNNIEKLSSSTEDPAKSDQEKASFKSQIKDLETKMLALTPNTTNSSAKYREFYTQNKNNSEGWIAGIRYTSDLIKQKQVKNASEILASIESVSKDIPLIHTLAQNILIGTLQDLKQYDKALSLTEKSLAKAAEGSKPRLLLSKAQILAAQGNKDGAKQVLDQILKNHETSAEAAVARGYRSLFN